jgi:hypothetical protein
MACRPILDILDHEAGAKQDNLNEISLRALLKQNSLDGAAHIFMFLQRMHCCGGQLHEVPPLATFAAGCHRVHT